MQQPKQQPEENQHEALLAWFLDLWSQIEANYTKILTGFGVAIAVVLIIVLMDSQNKQREEAAQAALGDVYIALFENRVSDAIVSAREVVDTYDGERPAQEALMAMANLHFEEGRVAEARDLFETYLRKNDTKGPLGYGAWAGLASCLEQEGKFAEAAKKFADFVGQEPNSPFAAVSLKEAGRCYELASMSQQAIDVYQRIAKDYSESAVARIATGQLSLMGVEVN